MKTQHSKSKKVSAFCIGAIGSGSGKTTLTLGLLSCLKKRGIKLQPFKCGPDYIDPGFHYEAGGVISRNLDSWMMNGEDAIIQSFHRNMQTADCAVIEGVMGLFDSASPTQLVGSTAHIAKILNVPIVLVINARGIARTIAPLVKGFIDFEEGVKIAGIIANNVGSEKHAAILAEALEAANLPPLLGYLKRNPKWQLPERHLGLVPDKENSKTDEWYDALAEEIETNIQVDKLLELCSLEIKTCHLPQPKAANIRLGIASDEAFHFYYQDNLDLLKEAGFELVNFSPIHDQSLPENLDALYIGGGFPEMFAQQLSANESMKHAIREFVNSAKPVLAECGGFMYLSEEMKDLDGKQLSMCGVLPCKTQMENKLHRLGYRETRFMEDTILGPAGTIVRGHEFHWSSMQTTAPISPAWEAKGVRNPNWEPCGIRKNNVFASYIHFHFASNPKVINHFYDRCKNNVLSN